MKDIIGSIIFFVIGLGCIIANGKLDVANMSIVVALVLFAVGLVLLIKGGDWFVDGATTIAAKFKIPEIIIGATVVSIGTTLPEVMVSAQAAAKGVGAMSYGNAIGSIICNTSLIAAITLAVKPAKADRKTLAVPVIFFFTAAILYSFTAYVTRKFTRTTGVVLLCMFAVYMVITVLTALKQKKASNDDHETDKEENKHTKSIGVALVLLVLGAVIIAFGATLLVDNGTIIAMANE